MPFGGHPRKTSSGDAPGRRTRARRPQGARGAAGRRVDRGGGAPVRREELPRAAETFPGGFPGDSRGTLGGFPGSRRPARTRPDRADPRGRLPQRFRSRFCHSLAKSGCPSARSPAPASGPRGSKPVPPQAPFNELVSCHQASTCDGEPSLGPTGEPKSERRGGPAGPEPCATAQSAQVAVVARAAGTKPWPMASPSSRRNTRWSGRILRAAGESRSWKTPVVEQPTQRCGSSWEQKAQ
jgi:hypothetical protein